MAISKAWASVATLLVLPVLAAEGPAAARSDASAGATSAAAGSTLSIVSWNLDSLANVQELRATLFWQKCAAGSWQSSNPGRIVPSCVDYDRKDIHGPPDFEARKVAPLRDTLARFAQQGMDILSVQSVRSEAALAAVLPKGYSVVCMTTRTSLDNVGYAARTSLAGAFTCRELTPFGEGRAASAMQLTLTLGSRTMTLLNVHLAPGCVTGPMDVARNGDCRSLRRQAAPLEEWIEAQARLGVPFAIIGDWNRDLEQEANATARTNSADPRDAIVASKVRSLLPELNDGVPVGSAMVLAAADRSPAPACEAHLSHAVLSKSLVDVLDPESVAVGSSRTSFLTRDKNTGSNYCALKIELRAR